MKLPSTRMRSLYTRNGAAIGLTVVLLSSLLALFFLFYALPALPSPVEEAHTAPAAAPLIEDEDAIALLGLNLGGYDIALAAWSNMNLSEKQALRDQAAGIARMAQGAEFDGLSSSPEVARTLRWAVSSFLADAWEKKIASETDISDSAARVFFEANWQRYAGIERSGETRRQFEKYQAQVKEDMVRAAIIERLEKLTPDADSYGLEGNHEIIEEISGKLEAGGGVDRIRLVALRNEGGVYNRGFLLEIIPSGEDPFVIPLADDVKGFEASIASKNFMSLEKSEILLTVDGGTRGDRFLVITVTGKQGEVVLDTYAEKIPAAVGRFFNDYRAEIIVQDTGERALIDLSPRKASYDRMSVYSDTGNLRKRVTLWVNELSRFEPVDLDHDGILEIKEVMDLNGAERADRIAYVEASLKYADGTWNVIDSWIAPAEDLNKMPMPQRIDLEG